MTEAQWPPLPKLLERLWASIDKPIPAGTPRRVHGAPRLPDRVTTVVGTRRVGKTMLLHQLRYDRLVAGVPQFRLPFVSIEYEQLDYLGRDHLAVLVNEYYRRFPSLRGTGVVTWCFDGVDCIPGWEGFIKRLLDDEMVEILLSGSTALTMPEGISGEMRGHCQMVRLHPFSFAEALEHGGTERPKPPFSLSPRTRSTIESAFLAYLDCGGFPEVQDLDEDARHRRLRDLVDVIILRDVLGRHRVRNVDALRALVRILLGYSAGWVSQGRLFCGLQDHGIAVSKDNVLQMLKYVHDCQLVRTIWMDTESDRQRMVNPRKLYPVDTGLIPTFSGLSSKTIRGVLETAVLLELERRDAEVTYAKTPGGFDIDLHARYPNGRQELIQILARPWHPTHVVPLLVGLDDAEPKYPGAHRFLLTLTADELPTETPPGVVAQPAYEWMLSRPVIEPSMSRPANKGGTMPA